MKATTLLTCFTLVLLAANVQAAGGGSMGSGPAMPREQRSPQQLAVDRYNQGIKDRDQALGYLAEATREADPKRVARFEKKARKEWRSAVKRFKAAIKLEPRLYQAHGSLGYALRRMGDYDASLEAYNRALALKPDYAEAIEYRAEAYLALGNLGATRQAHVRLMQLDPSLAGQLMQAITTFLAQPGADLDPAALAAFREWAEERMALGSLTRMDTQAQDWSPN